MNRHLITLLLALAFLATASGPQACVADGRSVEIRVTVLDPEHEPIPLVGVCAYTVEERSCSVTNASGVARIAVKLPAGDVRVPLELVGCPGASAQTMRRITSTMAVSYRYWIGVPQDAAAADATIQLGRAVQVSGRVLNPDGTPAKGNAFVRNQRALSTLDKEGRFVLPIAPGTLTELHFGVAPNVEWTVPLNLTSADLDLGSIKVLNSPGDAIIRVDTTNGQRLSPMAKDLGGLIALISIDGKVIRCFAVKPPGLAVANYGTGELPKVPAGTYYVTPGMFGNTPSYKVLDLIRAGRQAELDKAGVPKITAVTDRETSLTINLPEVEAVFEKLPEVPPAQPDPQPPSK